MKLKLIYFTLLILSLPLFLCSCIENPSDINQDNDFDLTNQEVKEGREAYKKLEIAVQNFEERFEKANSTEMKLGTFIQVNGTPSVQLITLNSLKSPMYLSLETKDTPIFLFQKEDTKHFGYFFDVDRTGYCKKEFKEEDIKNKLEENGMDQGMVFNIDIDPNTAKISYKNQWAIDVYAKDVLNEDEDHYIFDMINALGISKKEFFQTVLKYVFSFEDNRFDMKLSMILKPIIEGKKVDYTLELTYSLFIDKKFEKINLSQYNLLPAFSTELVDGFTSIDSPISSSYKGNNDTYKIELTKGVYIANISGEPFVDFVDENLNPYLSHYLDMACLDSTLKFMVVEEDTVLYMQVTQTSEEGYSISFEKKSDSIKSIKPLPEKVEETFAYEYDYVLYDVTSYNEKFMTFQNNMDCPIWIIGNKYRIGPIEGKQIMNFYNQNSFLMVVYGGVAETSDIDIFASKNYGNIDISNESDQYYLLGAFGIEGRFTFTFPKASDYRIELIDQENNSFYFSRDFRDTFFGFEGYNSINFMDFNYLPAGYYKIRIRLVE